MLCLNFVWQAPEIVATALVAAAAAASSIVTLGSAAAVEALGTFLPLYVLKTHGTQVLTDKRRGRTLVTYFLAVQVRCWLMIVPSATPMFKPLDCIAGLSSNVPKVTLMS